MPIWPTSGWPTIRSQNYIAASTSTRLRGASSILPRRYTQDTFESLAKRRVRVVANRLRYLEQFSIIFLQRSNRLVHSPVCQIFEWRFSKQFLKSQCKRLARHTCCHGQCFYRPRILDFLVHCFKRHSNFWIEDGA